MRSFRFFAICCLLCLALLRAHDSSAKETIVTMDKIICAIGPQIITLEEIGVERAILEISGDAMVYPGITKTALTNQRVLHELVARRILMNAAGRMGFSDVDPKDTEKAMEEFREKFASKQEYREFLKRYQLTDSLDEEQLKQDELAGDIVYRFRSIVMVRNFTHKKLDIQVKLSMKSAANETTDPVKSGVQGAASGEAMKENENKLFHKLLLEWLSDLAKRERISIRDEFYRAKLEKLLYNQ